MFSRITFLLFVLVVSCLAKHRQEIYYPSQGMVNVLSEFDFAKSSPYMVEGVVKFTTNAYDYPTNHASYIIDAKEEVLFYDEYPAGGKTWYLSNGTYVYSLIGTTPEEGYFCGYVNKTYQDQINYYKQSTYLTGVTPAPGGPRLTYLGNPIDASSCGQRNPFSALTDERGHLINVGQIYPLKVRNVTIIINTAVEFYNLYPGVGAEAVPDLPSLCYEPLDYCAVFYPDSPFIY